jgi:hypothetical protein
MGVFSWPLNEALGLISISFGGIGLLSMEDCVPLVFLRSWVLMVSYLCSKFHIFDRPILAEYVS